MTMHALMRPLDSAAQAWLDWMLPMTWQVGVLVCLLTLLSWLLRRHSARLRYTLWLLVPIRLVLPPSLALATGWSWWLLTPSLPAAPARSAETFFSDAAPAAREPSVSNTANAARSPRTEDAQAAPKPTDANNAPVIAAEEAKEPTFAMNWQIGLVGAWATIAAALLGRLGFGAVAARRLIAAAKPVRSGALVDEVDRWRRELAIRRPVGLRLFPGANVPMVVGLFRPCIVLPEQIERRLCADELQAVLVHELHHVARLDAAAHLAQAVLSATYFFHPAVWWAAAWLTRLREDACDEATVATLGGKRKAYGSGIVKMAEMLSARPPRLALGAAESSRQVKRRLERILDPQLKFGLGLSWPARLLLLLAAAVLLPTAARTALPAGDEAPDAPEASATTVDASLIDTLTQHEAKFAICYIEYVATQQATAQDDPATVKEEHVEFVRDEMAHGWFRKSTMFTHGVRTAQNDLFVEQDGKRAVTASQHNWNGLNPPMVGIYQPPSEGHHGYDAQPLFGFFPHDKPLSSLLTGKEAHVEVVEGDTFLQWTTNVGNSQLRYEVLLSREHDSLPVHYKYILDGRPIHDWRATRIEKADGVWYVAEGEMIITSTRWNFKVTRFDVGKRLPEKAMRYVIPDGAHVHDSISGRNYTQGRPVTSRTKPLTVTVRDVANEPIEEATVHVSANQSSRDETEAAPLERRTDAEGLARFDAVPDDVLYLKVAKRDMRPASLILGDGREITMYLAPRTSGRAIGVDGRKPQDGHVHLVIQSLPMSKGAIETPATQSRDSADVAPDGRFEFTQDLTLRRLGKPLLFVAYAEKGRQMAIKSVMPDELVGPLDFVLQPAALVTAEVELPRGAPPATQVEVLWSDSQGRSIAQTPVPLRAESGTLRGEVAGRLPPGKYQIRVPGTAETEKMAGDFVVESDETEVMLGTISLRPSKFAALRGQPAPELAGTPMAPSELKPLSTFRGQVVVLSFWSWLGEKVNDHPEQTPFFTLPPRFRDQPVHWIAIHDYRVHEPEALAAKVAGMRQANWGNEAAPFTSLIDDSEPIPIAEVQGPAAEGYATRRGVTAARYGVYSRLVLIDRQGHVVGSYTQEELEPALRRLLAADK
jgi:beta-lactamase regulating signal transducer with metallopeptidase domain